MLTRGLTYLRSNIIALLALFVALGGTGYAASGGFTSNGKLQACVGGKGTIRLLKAGKKCKEGQTKIAWNQAGPRGPQGAPGANGGAGANGVSVPNAQTAANALALGGTPASDFTHRDCGSLTGQIKGFVQLPDDFKTPTFTNVGGYNCSGQPVEAEALATGIYVVRFVGSPAQIAVATASPEALLVNDYASVHRIGSGEFEVGTWNHEGTPVGSSVELLVP